MTTKQTKGDDWFRKVCGNLREAAVDLEVVTALEAQGFNDFESLDELVKMRVSERAAALGVRSAASVTDSKFGNALKKELYEGIRLGGKSYMDIIIFNLSLDGRLNETPQVIMENYSTILNFSTFLAGFEFVAVSFGSEDSSDAAQTAALLLYMGFYLSSFSAVGCMLIIEFLRFAIEESDEFKLACIKNYKPALQAVPIAAFLSVVFMYLSLNINAHVVFNSGPAVLTNIVSAISAAGLFYLFIFMLMRRQVYDSAGRKIYTGEK